MFGQTRVSHENLERTSKVYERLTKSNVALAESKRVEAHQME